MKILGRFFLLALKWGVWGAVVPGLSVFSLSAQQLFWYKFLGGNSYDIGKSILIMQDGAIVVAGETQSQTVLGKNNHAVNNSDVFVCRYSTQGVVFWKHMLGGSGMEELSRIKATQDGGIVLIGTTTSADGDVAFNYGNSDIWVLKIGADGKIAWSKTFGGRGNDRGLDVAELPDGGYMICGESGSYDGVMRSPRFGRLDSWVARLAADGSLLWERHYGGSMNEQATSLLVLDDSTTLVVNIADSKDGQLKQALGGRDAWIFAIDAYGMMRWQSSFGGSDNDDVYGSCLDKNGDIVVTGTTFSANGYISRQAGLGDMWIFKIDRSGNLRYSLNFGGSKADGGNDVQATADGGVVACGLTRSTDGDILINSGYYDAFVVKLDNSGNKQWSRTFGHGVIEERLPSMAPDQVLKPLNTAGEGRDIFYSITEAPEGGYLATGVLEQPRSGLKLPEHNGLQDIWVCNFSDPARELTRAYVTPPLLSGEVYDQAGGAPLSAEVTLTDNQTLNTLAVVSTNEEGKFGMMLKGYGLLSINVLAKGYLFYGEDLHMDSLANKPGVQRILRLEPIRVGSKLVLNRIYFNSGKWDLLPGSRAELERLVKFLQLNDKIQIEISGHTDNTGDRNQKLKLSENRANAVKKYLVEHGISATRLRTKGYGMYRPIAPNTTEAGRQKNRRVEFEVVMK